MPSGSVREEIGRVEAVSSDIVTVSGLGGIALDSVVEFSSGARGVTFGFTPLETQVVMLGGTKDVKKGDLAKVVAARVTIRVSEELLGRVIDPLGNPLDGKPKVETGTDFPIEAQAKQINDRRHITQPLQTGFLTIDSQIPVGLGQRELLIGDRTIDKGDVGAAIIGNQTASKTGVIGIYVTVDAQTSMVKRRVAQLERYHCLEQSIVVVGRASDPPLLNYLAPMSGATIAEAFAAQGKDVLIIFDSLTQHAKVYRQISLLLGRSPGREAYPGDVFYLHSRLLERCGKFSPEVGGGSITALPMVDIQGEEITDFVTTNLMSITDGHILFSQRLANEGIRPAIDSGFSVSRIGSRAQHPVLRELSDGVRFTIIRYHEVERYASFGSELQEETLQLLRLGKAAYQCLHQGVDELLSIPEESIILHAISSKEIAEWSAEVITTVRDQFLKYARSPEIMPSMNAIMAASSYKDAQATIESVWKNFVSLPGTTPKQAAEVSSQAERETVIDLLREFPGEQYALNRSGKTAD